MTTTTDNTTPIIVTATYCGDHLRYDGKTVESCRLVEGWERSYYNPQLLTGRRVMMPNGNYAPVSPDSLPDYVMGWLTTKYKILVAAREQLACEAMKAKEREAAYAAEALGDGEYACPVCGHHQHEDGECEYCGDGIVSLAAEDDAAPAEDTAEAVVVTRHPALIAYLEELGVVPAGTPVLAHASAEDVRGKHVYGVLPMRLAAEAAMLTEVSMNVPAEWRGKELSLEQIKACKPELATYKVSRI